MPGRPGPGLGKFSHGREKVFHGPPNAEEETRPSPEPRAPPPPAFPEGFPARHSGPWASSKVFNLGALHGVSLFSPVIPFPLPPSQTPLTPPPTEEPPPTPMSPTAFSPASRHRAAARHGPGRPVPPAVTGWRSPARGHRSSEVRERRHCLHLLRRPGPRRVAPGAAVRRGRALPTCSPGGKGRRGPPPEPGAAEARRKRALPSPARLTLTPLCLDKSFPPGRRRRNQRILDPPQLCSGSLRAVLTNELSKKEWGSTNEIYERSSR